MPLPACAKPLRRRQARLKNQRIKTVFFVVRLKLFNTSTHKLFSFSLLSAGAPCQCSVTLATNYTLGTPKRGCASGSPAHSAGSRRPGGYFPHKNFNYYYLLTIEYPACMNLLTSVTKLTILSSFASFSSLTILSRQMNTMGGPQYPRSLSRE